MGHRHERQGISDHTWIAVKSTITTTFASTTTPLTTTTTTETTEQTWPTPLPGNAQSATEEMRPGKQKQASILLLFYEPFLTFETELLPQFLT